MNLKLAFLNLFRHLTRSLLSLFTIAGAVASIIVFRGYSSRILSDVQKFGVEHEYGHLQIGQEKLWSPSSERTKDQLFDNSEALQQSLKKFPEIRSTSARLPVQALLSHEDSQFGARLIGYSPEKETSMEKYFTFLEGSPLKSSEGFDILLGSGMQKRLKAKMGDTVSVVTQTADGVMNAMDMTVQGIFQTGLAEIDNQIGYVSIKTAQTLIDTSKIQVLILRLNEIGQTFDVFERLKQELQKTHPGLTVKTWRDLATLYNQVEEFYNIQNFIIQTILSTLTILAILNTVGMSVYERTGEIGTLRSMGLKKSEIIWQFLAEGFFLATLGGIAGTIGGALAVGVINTIGFTTAMPGASTRVTIYADFSLSHVWIAVGLGYMATLIGTVIPSWNASRLPIVDALRRNI